MTHLLGVASLVLENGAQSEEEVIGALLYDAAEDQGAAPGSRTSEQFGEQVGHIVDACTDSYDNPKPPWRPRKEAYVTHVRERSNAEATSRPPRLARRQAPQHPGDHRRRARGGDALFERFSGKKDGTIWYYAALVEAFRGLPEPDGGRARTRGHRPPSSRRHLLSHHS